MLTGAAFLNAVRQSIELAYADYLISVELMWAILP